MGHHELLIHAAPAARLTRYFNLNVGVLIVEVVEDGDFLFLARRTLRRRVDKVHHFHGFRLSGLCGCLFIRWRCFTTGHLCLPARSKETGHTNGGAGTNQPSSRNVKVRHCVILPFALQPRTLYSDASFIQSNRCCEKYRLSPYSSQEVNPRNVE